MTEITIPIELYPQHDEKAQIIGYIEKKSITIHLKDKKTSGYTIYKAPCIVFQEHDQKGSEQLGINIMKDAFTIKLTKKQAKFFKKVKQ